MNDFFNLIYFFFSIRDLDIFIGSSFLFRNDTNSLLYSVFLFLNNFGLSLNNLHIVLSHIGKISLFETGLLSNQNNPILFSNFNVNKSSFLYLCGVDLDKFSDSFLSNSQFIVFQGSFFNQRLYDCVDLILPTTVYTEDVFHYLI